MGVPTRMLGLLMHMVRWCSCTAVKGEEELEGYAETPEVRKDFVSRADIMASSNAAGQRLSSFKHRRTGSIKISTLGKELEVIPEAHGPHSARENDCPEEDATVLVKLDSTSAIPAPQPLKPPTVSKQAQYATPTPAVAISEESQGPATPCQGTSRAVSRTDSNTSVSVHVEPGRFSDAAPAEPCPTVTAATPAPKAAQEVGPTAAAAKAESADEAVASKPVNAGASASAAAPVVAAELAAVTVIKVNQPDSSAVASSTAGSDNHASNSNGTLSYGMVTQKNSREFQEDRAVAAVLTGSDQFQILSRAAFAGVFDAIDSCSSSSTTGTTAHHRLSAAERQGLIAKGNAERYEVAQVLAATLAATDAAQAAAADAALALKGSSLAALRAVHYCEPKLMPALQQQQMAAVQQQVAACSAQRQQMAAAQQQQVISPAPAGQQQLAPADHQQSAPPATAAAGDDDDRIHAIIDYLDDMTPVAAVPAAPARAQPVPEQAPDEDWDWLMAHDPEFAALVAGLNPGGAAN